VLGAGTSDLSACAAVQIKFRRAFNIPSRGNEYDRHCPNAGCASPTCREVSMNLHLLLTPIVSLIAGILILVAPRLLNYIVAIYLILIGLLGLLGSASFHLK
jgi:hypothetical protein